jgi:hypothetical protein
MPYVETTSERTDESREITMVTTQIVDQLEQPQIEGEVRSAVESEFKRFDDVRVRDFVPVIVERRVRSDLRALAHAS